MLHLEDTHAVLIMWFKSPGARTNLPSVGSTELPRMRRVHRAARRQHRLQYRLYRLALRDRVSYWHAWWRTAVGCSPRTDRRIHYVARTSAQPPRPICASYDSGPASER